jgi:hypothetical protein
MAAERQPLSFGEDGRASNENKTHQKVTNRDKRFRAFFADFCHFLSRRRGKKGRKHEKKGRIAGGFPGSLAEI